MACPKGRAIRYIFSFFKKKEKDAASITHTTLYKKTPLSKNKLIKLSYLNRVFRKRMKFRYRAAQ
jgi:hypothetical protein